MGAQYLKVPRPAERLRRRLRRAIADRKARAAMKPQKVLQAALERAAPEDVARLTVDLDLVARELGDVSRQVVDAVL